jgi:hypothetical protein
MEKAQLFKRLLAMTYDELAMFIKFDEPVDIATMKLDLAARTRHIIQAVQFEDMWQSLPENSPTYKIYLSMRLAPMTLCSVLDNEQEMHCLEWRLVMPNYADIAEDDKPSCFGEYLQHMDRVEIVDIDDYDIGEACDFLDKAYDFSRLSDSPGSSQQQRW